MFAKSKDGSNKAVLVGVTSFSPNSPCQQIPVKYLEEYEKGEKERYFYFIFLFKYTVLWKTCETLTVKQTYSQIERDTYRGSFQ